MSCHFHLMRKRKAAAAKKAVKATQSVETEAPNEEVKAEEKPAKKASKGRRKGDA